MRRLVLTIALLLGAGSLGWAEAGAPLLLRQPSVSRTQIVFSYAGTLWIANREGGKARRLTTGGHESNPVFSPDGRTGCIYRRVRWQPGRLRGAGNWRVTKTPDFSPSS